MTAKFFLNYPDAFPKPGMHLIPDQWPVGGNLMAGSLHDWEYFQTTLRIQTGQELIPALPVKVTITGRRAYRTVWNDLKVRVRIEFLKDGDPSDFSGGWLIFQRATQGQEIP